MVLSVLCIVGVLYCNYEVDSYASKFTVKELENLESKKVALVLGTSQYLTTGSSNPYFRYRMNTAAALYKYKKVKYLLLSGDNGDKYYNEPKAMKEALMKLGVPEKVIYLDYAGFRTFDSVVRCREVFGEENIVIISQPSHVRRAVYIARKKGIEAVGFEARDVEVSWQLGFRTTIREWLARVKVFIDLYILHTHPKFLGTKIQIGSK